MLASCGNLSAIARNPYIYAAIGEGALAVEMTTGAMKKGSENWGLGSGWLSRLFERMSEKDKPKTTDEQRAYKQLGEVIQGYPKFADYLKQGGAATIVSLRTAKFNQGKKGAEMAISFDELLEAEKGNTVQQDRLKEIQHNFPREFAAQINLVAESMFILKFEKQDDYLAKARLIEESQGLEKPAAELVSASPAKSEEAKPNPEKDKIAVG